MKCPTCNGTGCIDEYRLVDYRLPSEHHERIIQQKNSMGNWSTLFVSSYGTHIKAYCDVHGIEVPGPAIYINYPDNPEKEITK